MTFDEWYLKGCYWVSEKSKDPSTHIGCILVNDNNRIISCGYNGIPHHLDDSDERLTSPDKYQFVEHAERNCIYSAAQHGISTLNSILYINGFPCCDCARAIISAGIKRLVVHSEFYDIMTSKLSEDKTWLSLIDVSQNMLLEVGIITDFISTKLDVTGFFRGQKYGL